MIDCDLKQLTDGRWCGYWYCPECDPKRKRLLPIKARRNCRVSGQLPVASGQTPAAAYRLLSYAQTLARWIVAGRPVRTDWEVADIHARHCYPCDHYDPKRETCTDCGCKARREGMAVRNKIKMATEHCPKGKW